MSNRLNRHSDALYTIFADLLKDALWCGDYFALDELIGGDEELDKALWDWAHAAEQEQEKRSMAINALKKALRIRKIAIPQVVSADDFDNNT